MNNMELLFDEEIIKKPPNKKPKVYSLKLWEKWEMNENFIEALFNMNSSKIYEFKIVYRKGVLFYLIETQNLLYNYYKNKVIVNLEDMEYLKNYFESNGWEIDYYDYELDRKLYIKGRL